MAIVAHRREESNVASVAESGVPRWLAEWLPALLVLAVGVCGRLPALTSWWCLDDWGQLARAAGYLPGAPDLPARWLSQHAWWSLTWPPFGLDAAAHAWSRIFLHALGAVAVSRIAMRVALSPLAQLAAGVLFAATPVAFTPLYWASGVQELLGGALALWAVERWLAARRRDVLIACALGAGAIVSKESALGLPLLFGALAWAGRGKEGGHPRWQWSAAAVLLLAAILETSLVAGHFATGVRDPYATGGFLVMLGNLGKFGWWLPTPVHYFTAQMTWPKAILGLLFLAAWGAGGIWSWRRGRRLALVTWCCALASLAPALPLVHQARPYLAYVAAACGALAIASLLPARSRPQIAVMLVIALTAIGWSQATMRGRIGRLDVDGRPADPIVRAMQLSRESAQELTEAIAVAGLRDEPLVIYQAHLSTPRDAADGAQGDQSAAKSPRHGALSGSMGASLVCGNGSAVEWTGSLLEIPDNAVVICERAKGFQPWGTTHEALRYAAALFVVAGRYDDAVAHLARAAEIAGGRPLVFPAENRIGLPANALAMLQEKFDRHLIAKAIKKEISGEAFLAYSGFLARR